MAGSGLPAAILADPASRVSTTHTKTTAIMGVGAAQAALLRQLGRGKGDGADLGADVSRAAGLIGFLMATAVHVAVLRIGRRT